jgi:hypothetical protein
MLTITKLLDCWKDRTHIIVTFETNYISNARKWANFTWISEKSQEARGEGPPEGREYVRAEEDFP